MKHIKLFYIVFNVVTCIWFHIGIVEGIIGGETANHKQFKYQVSLQNNGVHFCGGSIISNRHVLTAAHCVIGSDNHFKKSKITVVGGVTNLLTKFPRAIEMVVEKIHIPKSYQLIDLKSKAHHVSSDIAVLQLEGELDLSENSPVNKIELPAISRNYPNYEHQSAIISGFGVEAIVRHAGRKIEYVLNNCIKLKYAETMIIPNDKCHSSSHTHVHAIHMCAQVKQSNDGNPEGVCLGDSGGALVYDGKTVIGVLAGAFPDCNESKLAGVYSRVTSFLPFIHKAMRDAKSPDIRTAIYVTEKILKNRTLQLSTKLIEFHTFIE